MFLKHLWNKNFAYIPGISLRARLCWLSLAWNSVICILFLDFVRFAIGKHMKLQHGVQRPAIAQNFTVLKKCGSKLDCLVYEMELKPALSVQSDSIRAKLFTDA